MQFTELVYIAYTEGEIIEIMYRGVFVYISMVFLWWVTSMHTYYCG